MVIRRIVAIKTREKCHIDEILTRFRMMFYLSCTGSLASAYTAACMWEQALKHANSVLKNCEELVDSVESAEDNALARDSTIVCGQDLANMRKLFYGTSRNLGHTDGTGLFVVFQILPSAKIRNVLFINCLCNNCRNKPTDRVSKP